jgi:hypothetical protein
MDSSKSSERRGSRGTAIFDSIRSVVGLANVPAAGLPGQQAGSRRHLKRHLERGHMRLLTRLLLSLMLISTALSLTPQKDVPARIDSARQALLNARNQLEQAGGDWGGHRANAVKHIDEAMTELNEAEKWARDHHEM